MKKTIIAIFAGLAVILGAVWWFQPRPIIDEDYEVTVVRTGVELQDVTEQVDLDALEELLRSGTHGRFRKNVTAFQLTEDTVSISGNSSQHIEFSVTRCVVYDSGERYGYTIQNSDELWAEVLALMPE